MTVTQSATDAVELEPAVEQIEANLSERPKQMVLNDGLMNHATVGFDRGLSRAKRGFEIRENP
jgi:hypothetical protein